MKPFRLCLATACLAAAVACGTTDPLVPAPQPIERAQSQQSADSIFTPPEPTGGEAPEAMPSDSIPLPGDRRMQGSGG
ncbi:hypothetical protein BH23GEM3_BH23GEM3_11510 [soil metagenome]